MSGIGNTNNVKIDLATLKAGFKEYLEGQSLLKPEEANSASGASIFLHSEQFKNYLVQEIGLDASVLSQNTSELIQNITSGNLIEDALKNEDGSVNEEVAQNLQEAQTAAELQEEEAKGETDGTVSTVDNPLGLSADDSFMLQAFNEALLDEEVINKFDTDNDGGLSNEEISEFLSVTGLDATSDEISFDDLSKAVQDIYDQNSKDELLEKVFEDKDVISALDIDGDGELSEEEKDKFKEFITGYASDGDELTQEDIQKAFNDILDGKFDYSSINPEKESAEKIADDTGVNYAASEGAAPAATCGSGGVGGGGGVSGGGGSGVSGSSGTSGSSNSADSVDSMTLEQLEAKKVEKQQAVDTAQKEIDSINSGEKYKSEEENVAKLEEAYKEALKKESDEKCPELSQCLDDIDSKEAEINETQTSISELTTKIFDQKNTVDGLSSTLSSLKSTQSELNSMSTDNSEKQAEISQKKASIQTKINEVQAEYDKQKAALTELEGQKTDKEKALETQKGELETLKTNKTTLEGSLKENFSEATQKAMDDYNEAKKALDDKKESDLKTAQDNLTTAQGELKEINDKINEKKAQETSKEFQVMNTSLPKEVAQALDNRLGSGFSSRLEEICEKIQCEPEDLVGLMYSESGLTTGAVNKSSGATGLIQFLPSTANWLGTSTSALKQMNGVQQLDYVEKFLVNCKKQYFGEGKMTGGDLYSLVWLPARAKQDVLVESRGAKYYSKGLDVDGDGRNTKSDLSQRIKNKYNEAMKSIL